MTFILLVLMDCEVISYVHNNGYGRNFKYRKKVFQAPTIVEYPVFKQFDGKFWQIASYSFSNHIIVCKKRLYLVVLNEKKYLVKEQGK